MVPFGIARVAQKTATLAAEEMNRTIQIPASVSDQIISRAKLEHRFPTELSAIQYVKEIRQKLSLFACPDCSSDRHYQYGDGTFKCVPCGRRFSVRSGTIFQSSRLPLSAWLRAIWHVTASPKISSTNLGLSIGVPQHTAWWMMETLNRAHRAPSFIIPTKIEPPAEPKKPRINALELNHPIGQLLLNLPLPPRWWNESLYLDLVIYRAHNFVIAMGNVDFEEVRYWATKKGFDIESADKLERIIRDQIIARQRKLAATNKFER